MRETKTELEYYNLHGGHLAPSFSLIQKVRFPTGFATNPACSLGMYENTVNSLIVDSPLQRYSASS